MVFGGRMVDLKVNLGLILVFMKFMVFFRLGYIQCIWEILYTLGPEISQ